MIFLKAFWDVFGNDVILGRRYHNNQHPSHAWVLSLVEDCQLVESRCCHGKVWRQKSDLLDECKQPQLWSAPWLKPRHDGEAPPRQLSHERVTVSLVAGCRLSATRRRRWARPPTSTRSPSTALSSTSLKLNEFLTIYLHIRTIGLLVVLQKNIGVFTNYAVRLRNKGSTYTVFWNL